MSKFKIINKKSRETTMKNRANKSPSFIKSGITLQEYKPSDGNNSVRIVPPLHDEPHGFHLGIDLRVHFCNNTMFVGTNTLDKEIPDPLYAEFRKQKSRGTDESVLAQLRGTPRTLMFVIDTEDDENVLKYWLCPTSVVDGIIGVSKNRRNGEVYPIECPNEGKIIFFHKTGKGIATRYSGFSLDDETFPLDDAIADQLVYFEDLLKVPTVDEVKDHILSLDLGTDDNTSGSGVFESADPLQEIEEALDDEIPGEAHHHESAEESFDEPEPKKGNSLKERMAERKKRMRKAHEDPSVTV